MVRPHRTLLVCALLGFAVVGLVIGTGLIVSRDTHVELTGKIAHVRMAEIRAGQTVVIVDFRVTNPSGYPFMVKSADIEVMGGDGKLLTGRFIAGPDVKPLFAALPELGGEQYNASIGIRETVKKRETVERMVAAIFDAPVAELRGRKKIAVRFKEVDGPVSVVE
ncbi:MAG: hypothetical protein FJW30_25500 [Acidobacteria bacterium]|nr:hypothetical protein [Acidobacteriota bacterium]